MIGKMVAGAISSLVNTSVQNCYEGLLVLVLLYGSERMISRGKDKSRVRAVLEIRRMDRVPNVVIRELCKVDERIGKSIL